MRQSAPAHDLAARSKGKQRELNTRDEGNGGPDGVLIDLELVADSPYQSAYVVPIYLGASGAQSKFLVQVDTGSSDLWVTSTACSSALCNQVGGAKYDSSHSIASGLDLHLKYAQGDAEGLVVWDTLQFGGYSIDHQALIAASTVANEPLSSDFNGVLGLALPGNSLIAGKIPPTTSDTPDGASFSSNLFSITPISMAPGARFLSLALERPGSNRISSVLGIGRHPSDLVPDPSKIEYATVVATSSTGPLWWQANIEGINVYVDGVRKPVAITSTSARGPTAILDSGAPLIVATTSIANGIYGAMGISPAADGNYYIPCATPINMTIQLDNRMEIPLHPLDLTYYPLNDASSETCIGAIQTPAQLNFQFTAADMLLGVPFLRNTYTVMAFDPPAANGSFPLNSGDSNAIEQVRPRLGLLNLTDPAVAADEFHQVRVLKQPLQKTNTAPQQPSSSSHGLSAGVIALIALLGFFGMCFLLFGARWAIMKRRFARRQRAEAAAYGANDSKDDYTLNVLGYHLAPMHTKTSSAPSEDELRQKRFEAYKRRQMESTYTDDTAITFIDGSFRESKGFVPDEFGAFPQSDTPDTLVPTPHSPTRGYFDSWRDTLVNPDTLPDGEAALLSPPPRSARRSDLSLSPRSLHHRTLSGGPGVEAPLLGHARTGSDPAQQDARSSIDIVDRGLDSPRSMAGVGTASRSRRVSGMSPAPSPSALGEFPPEVRGEGGRSRSPPRVPPPALVVPGPEPVLGLDATRNASRTSLQGHER